MKNIYLLNILLAVVFMCAACSNNDDEEGTPAYVTVDLWQVNSIKHLLDGGYDGTVSVGNLRTHGDTGLGCFDKANGEMIVLHDTVFQCTYDSIPGEKGGIKVVAASENTLTPFADVAWMKSPQSIGTFAGGTMAELTAWLNTKVDTTKIYACTMTGTLTELLVRTELAQEKPYRTFTEVLKTDERRFNEQNISGTLVVLYAPESMSDECGSGWHYHFISSDRKLGGHALNFTASTLQCQVQQVKSVKEIQ